MKPVKAPCRRVNTLETNGLKIDLNEEVFSKITTTKLVKDTFQNIFTVQSEKQDGEELLQERNVKIVFNHNRSSKCAIKRSQKLHEKIFILVKDSSSTDPIIGRIEYIFKKNSITMAHINLFMHSSHTILGDISDPREIFLLNKCIDINMKNMIQVVNVTYIKQNKFSECKSEDIPEPIDEKENTFFYKLQYNAEFGRFEHPNSSDTSFYINDKKNSCNNCTKKNLEKKSQIPELLTFIEKDKNNYFFYNFKLQNEKYKIGSFVYLKPGIFGLTSDIVEQDKSVINDRKRNVDEIEYPEYYRKTLENRVRGSNKLILDPFEIAEIIAIYVTESNKKNVQAIVRRMYRAEQIIDDYTSVDMNMLFWSEEKFIIEYTDIIGKCYVSHLTNIKNPLLWSKGGPDRFYFKNKYDSEADSIIPEYQLPNTAILTGREVYVNYDYRFVDEDRIQYIPSHKLITPLRGLDLFSGCGGLSEGMINSGLSQTEWAVESDLEAANAFKLNNPDATVFVDDCNHLLKLAMSGKKTNKQNQKIPQRGEVEFICGGPPCQGFSGLNQFTLRNYSLLQNSLVLSFFSYIDYYRPKFFIMENVRNFVSYNKGMFFRKILQCILRMGYQCTFGILQAGNFGVPQTRRRLIIMAAAPGESLPFYPEPTHTFNKRSSSLNVQIDKKNLQNKLQV